MLCSAVASTIAMLSVFMPQTSSDGMLESIRDSFQLRSKTQSAVIVYDATLFYSKNAFAGVPGLTQPEHDLRGDVADCRIEISGGMIRNEFILVSIETWLETGKNPRFISTFDDTDSMQWNAEIANRPQTGNIYASMEYKDRESGYLAPVLLLYRWNALDGFNIDFNRLKLSPTRSIYKETECCVLSTPIGDGIQRELWVDLSHDHNLRRFVEYDRLGKIRFELGLDYGPNGDHPESWIASHYRNESLSSAIEGSVKRWETDIPVRSERFRIEFPVGTVVYNEKTKQHFEVLPNGGKRDVWDKGQKKLVSEKFGTVKILCGLMVPIVLMLFWRRYYKSR